MVYTGHPAPADNLKKYKIKQTPNIKVILKTQDLSEIKTIMVFAYIRQLL